MQGRGGDGVTVSLDSSLHLTATRLHAAACAGSIPASWSDSTRLPSTATLSVLPQNPGGKGLCGAVPATPEVQVVPQAPGDVGYLLSNTLGSCFVQCTPNTQSEGTLWQLCVRDRRAAAGFLGISAWSLAYLRPPPPSY